MAKREVIDNIKRYLSKLEEAGIRIEKAYLYGSYVNGIVTEESDIDLMLVSKDFDNNSDKFAGIVWKLTMNIDTRIEPYMMGLNKFNTDNVSPLLQTIRKEGIAI